MTVVNRMVLLCEDSVEGMLTAIYDGFVWKNEKFSGGPDAISNQYEDQIVIYPVDGYEFDMFSTTQVVETDYEKAEKTMNTIRRRLGEEVYLTVLRALCHFSSDRAVYVFGFLVRAFQCGSSVLNRLYDDYVMRVIELSRKAGREAHLFTGFVRFHEVGQNQVLYAKIEPKCNVLPLIEGHFSERFPGENFIIYDAVRKFSVVHKKFMVSYFVKDQEMSFEDLDKEGLRKRNEGDDYKDLWKTYFDAIFIPERENARCQNTLVPKWYRKNMPEFHTQKG